MPNPRFRSSRTMFKVFSIFAPVVMANFACGNLAPQSSTVRQIQNPVSIRYQHSQNVVFQYSLHDKKEREDFETRVIPAVHDYIGFWEKNGALLPSKKIKFVIQPDPSLDKKVTLAALYGPSTSTEWNISINIEGETRPYSANTGRTIADSLVTLLQLDPLDGSGGKVFWTSNGVLESVVLQGN